MIVEEMKSKKRGTTAEVEEEIGRTFGMKTLVRVGIKYFIDNDNIY